MRVIPSDIPDILTMNIEPDLLDAMLRKTGLGFICGETGSGKSHWQRHCTAHSDAFPRPAKR